MITFNLTEYQLGDVRRAIDDYIESHEALKTIDKQLLGWPAMNPYHCNDRQALRKLANEIVDIVLNGGVSGG